ncbi:deoxynucleoside kinase [Procambarus clarkii]|uniref:deoxynucleoside kinase n=1 Tax=Procambarus clarkii TaxID=6728 RepID=UPI001E6771B0|nr:deoxynucleoside kinase-like [Procambarus clarkii]
MWRFVSRIRGVSLRLPNKLTPEGAKYEPCGPDDCTLKDIKPRDEGRPKFTVCIEGNIGSGKSTLLNYLSKFREVEVLDEQIDKWRSVKGNNLLELVYRDPARWSYLFQSYVQLTMAESHAMSTAAPVKLLERSIHSARFCFVENLYLSGKMSESEYHVYCEWYKWLTEYFDCRVDLVVYLRTDPRLVYARAKSRARVEEQEVPLKYFEDLHKRYEEWMCEERFPLPAPVFVLDANDDLPSMYRKYKLFTHAILNNKSFLASLV